MAGETSFWDKLITQLNHTAHKREKHLLISCPWLVENDQTLAYPKKPVKAFCSRCPKSNLVPLLISDDSLQLRLKPSSPN
jgi:hypothetical protein